MIMRADAAGLEFDPASAAAVRLELIAHVAAVIGPDLAAAAAVGLNLIVSFDGVLGYGVAP